MDISIVGGGIMGISLGYFLSRRGATVEIFEASPVLGGLAGPLSLEDGTSVDRFYHAILTSDEHLKELCAELNIAQHLRFRQTKNGFYHGGRMHSMNTMIEFLRFPPLSAIERVRLGMTVACARFVRDWRRLDGISVEEWLRRWGGNRAFETLWRPMLKAKFDGNFDDVPATYIWARLVRMGSTRGGANQKEEAGHLIGGYTTLIKAMVERIEAAGGKVHVRCPVQEVEIQQGRALGVRLGEDMRPYGAVAVTMQAPVFRQLIPGASTEYHDFLSQTHYLGIVCPLLVLDRPLTGYWTLNIADDGVPFTGILETTSYIDPKYVGGHHLVYLPKYTAPGSRWQQMTDEEIRETCLETLESMFPGFERSWVRYILVHRERYVDPHHQLNMLHLVPPVRTPVENLYLVTTAQLYPALMSGESVTRHARRAADIILDRGTSLKC